MPGDLIVIGGENGELIPCLLVAAKAVNVFGEPLPHRAVSDLFSKPLPPIVTMCIAEAELRAIAQDGKPKAGANRAFRWEKCQVTGA